MIIGWREWASLPAFGVNAIKAKIDTGARTSAIHAFHLHCWYDSEQQAHVSFRLHPRQRHRAPEVAVTAPVVEWRSVKSSNGKVEKRPVVRTRLKLGPMEQTVLLTLTNRDEMGFRMLIGREALKRRFIVDSALSYGLGEKPRKTPFVDVSTLEGQAP
ncbi:ATP-dependent zinc protease family protein [Yunchengibacter salinarum]|uniref:ATP-dependent zinc protease family protein n=1 Tax=Yunchengibacter salinarum TaxID=3133399 RepID=UPI0035B645EA